MKAKIIEVFEDDTPKQLMAELKALAVANYLRDEAVWAREHSNDPEQTMPNMVIMEAKEVEALQHMCRDAYIYINLLRTQRRFI